LPALHPYPTPLPPRRHGHRRALHSFPTRRSSDLILTSRLSLSKHLAHNLGNLLLLGKIGVFHNRRNASSRLLLLISKHQQVSEKIGRAVQQECRDRPRMPSSA